MDVTGLLETVVILAACIVFLAKQAMDAYKGSYTKNGKNGKVIVCPKESCESLLTDLHRWHSPVSDPMTGQPRFLWYENSKELSEELKRNRDAIDELRKTIAKMNDAIEALALNIENMRELRST